MTDPEYLPSYQQAMHYRQLRIKQDGKKATEHPQVENKKRIKTTMAQEQGESKKAEN